jgi:predicted Fe-Mo cluster-binding NifX family protein
MKIAITSMGAKLEDKVDPRFGRCHYFILFDTETNKFEAIENTGAQGMGGVGIQSGQIMADKGVETVLTGNCGPNAVQEAIDKYKSGELKAISQANAAAHSGMNKEN